MYEKFAVTNRKELLEEYIKDRFSVGLMPYEESLRKHGLNPGARHVLDIGCGPGQWSFAAANVARQARVYGCDPNRQLIEFAREYASRNNFSRITFDGCGYDGLEGRFPKGHFDAVLCNSVLMYIDRNEAFRIFRYLLGPDGRLFLFHNHHLGYYMHKSLRALRHGSILQLYDYGFKPLLLNQFRRAVLGAKGCDSVLTLGYLNRIAARHGIRLEQIPNEPQLSYRASFMGLPYVFSLRGEVI